MTKTPEAGKHTPECKCQITDFGVFICPLCSPTGKTEMSDHMPEYFEKTKARGHS